MAVKTPNKSLALLANTQQNAIEVYKADFATPSELDAMRFWLQKELNRVQGGFISTDEAVKILASELLTLSEGGTQGPAGVRGRDGANGAAGRSVTVYQQEAEPSGANPGDIWLVEEFV